MAKPKSTTPTLDKLVAVADDSQVCGEFLEWLLKQKKLTLCQPHIHCKECYTMGLTKAEFRENYASEAGLYGQMAGIASKVELIKGRFHAPQCGASNAFVPVSVSVENLLHQFFKIDPYKVEQERRAMLANLRRINT